MFIQRNMLLSFLSLLIFLLLFIINPVAAEDKTVEEIKKGTVTGQIMVKGGVPLSFGQAMFYNASSGPPPNPEKYERTPDISKTMDAEGKFKVELPEGRYYLGAIRRVSGDRLGPPQEGDYVFRSLNKEGKPREYAIRAGEVYDAGTFEEAFQLDEETMTERRVTTAIKGTLRSMEWQPVKDAVVLAFAQPRIGKKPLFVSDKTDKDGNYVLPLVEGTYYLRVRNSFAAGPPQPGQIVGYYGEGKPIPLTVRECDVIKGIDFQVIVFPGRGPFSGTPPSTPKKTADSPE